MCSRQADDNGGKSVDLKSCVAVQRLLDEGAIIFGKTNTPSRCRDWQTYNDTFGATPNPYDPQRTSGGSSGGSCVAVAAGHSPVELGADVAGSIRVPACFCGVFGMQGTYGHVPTTLWCEALPGTDPSTIEELEAPMIDESTAHLTVAPHVFKVIGPICKAPEDLALMTAVLERTAPMLPRTVALYPSRMFRLVVLSEIGSSEPSLSGTISDALEQLQRQLEESDGISMVPLRKRFPSNFGQVSYDLYHQILANRDLTEDFRGAGAVLGPTWLYKLL